LFWNVIWLIDLFLFYQIQDYEQKGNICAIYFAAETVFREVQGFPGYLWHPVKNDFVKTCKKYLQTLGILLSFDDIGKMSFKKLVKEKVIQAGFKYLLEKKNEPGKQTQNCPFAVFKARTPWVPIAWK
jgi:hypothetical protein